LVNKKGKEIFSSIEWWKARISILDPLWQLKAMHAYALWRLGRPEVHWRADKARFQASFIDDCYELLDKYAREFKNDTEFKDWSFYLAYILMHFHYIADYVYKN